MLDDGRLPGETIDMARELAAELDRVLEAVRATPRTPRPSAEEFALAERLALLFGAAASIAMYAANRDRTMTGLWTGGAWLSAALARVGRRLGVGHPSDRGLDALLDLASAEHLAGRPVSLLPDWADAGVWR